MPEQLTDDELTTLFSDLRADTINAVRPPGTGEVRTTVANRRSRTRHAWAVAAVGVVLAGVGLHTPDHERADPGTAADPLPTMDPRVEKELELQNGVRARIASAALPNHDVPQRKSVMTSELPLVYAASMAHPVPAGHYEMSAACSGGGGIVTLSVTSAPLLPDGNVDFAAVRDVGGVNLPCSARPAPLAILLGAAVDGKLMVRAQPDFEAMGVSGVAFDVYPGPLWAGPTGLASRTGDLPAMAAEAERDLATVAPGPRRESVTPVTRQVVDGQQLPTHVFPELDPGDYVVRLSCVGVGDLLVKATADNDAMLAEVSELVGCGARATTADVKVSLTTRARVTLAVGVDELPVDRAGYAAVVTRVLS